jgi:hypothetical protein
VPEQAFSRPCRRLRTSKLQRQRRIAGQVDAANLSAPVAVLGYGGADSLAQSNAP